MLNKEVYKDYFEEKDYEAILDKSLLLQSLPHLFVFYLAASYCKFIKDEEFISEESYSNLCGILESHPKLITPWLEDIKNKTCTMIALANPEDYEKGLTYPIYIEELISEIEETIEIDSSHEVWLEFESTD